MKPPPPVHVLHLFPDLHAALLALVEGLDETEWQRPTTCPGWSVHDVALHLLGGDLGILSRQRDGYRLPGGVEPATWEELVALINTLNARWITATRRLSPRLLRELLAFSGREVIAYFRTLDPHALGGQVSWAGPEAAPVWLDLAREYTERWLHQQQIREAVGRPDLTAVRLLKPVLATFVHALPRTYGEMEAAPGTLLTLTIGGEAGGTWHLRREQEAWRLYQGAAGDATTTIALSPDLAWRLFTRGVTAAEARARLAVRGDEALVAPLLQATAIIA